MQKRKLLFKQIMKCPDWHTTICNVYEDNGYYYYECPICGTITGLQMSGDEKEDVNIIGGKLHRKNIVKEESFSGYHVDKVISIFRKRKAGVRKN